MLPQKSPWGDVLGIPVQEETRDTLERLHLWSELEKPKYSSVGVSGRGHREKHCPSDLDPDKQMRMGTSEQHVWN